MVIETWSGCGDMTRISPASVAVDAAASATRTIIRRGISPPLPQRERESGLAVGRNGNVPGEAVRVRAPARDRLGAHFVHAHQVVLAQREHDRLRSRVTREIAHLVFRRALVDPR